MEMTKEELIEQIELLNERIKNAETSMSFMAKEHEFQKEFFQIFRTNPKPIRPNLSFEDTPEYTDYLKRKNQFDEEVAIEEYNNSVKDRERRIENFNKEIKKLELQVIENESGNPITG